MCSIVIFQLNGLLTLGENIADSAGLKSSYDAYMSWLEDHEDPRANLPALNMNKEQLFFLSFAQVLLSNQLLAFINIIIVFHS